MKKIILCSSVAFFVLLYSGCTAKVGNRQTLSLNGTWQLAEGKKDIMPPVYNHTVPVPGLVTLAQPAIDNVAPPVPDRYSDRNPNLFHG